MGSVFIAYKNMKEAKAGAAIGELPEIVFNRRPKQNDGSVKSTLVLPNEVADTYVIRRTEDGTVRMTFSLPSDWPELNFGPIDPEVCVLRVENMEGKIFNG